MATGIKLDGYGLSSAEVAAIQDVVNAIGIDTVDLAGYSTTAEVEALVAEESNSDLTVITGTTHTLTNDDNGNVLRFTNAGLVTVTVPSGLQDGFTCLLVQGGSGVVTAAAGGGVSLTPSVSLSTNGAESDLLVIPKATNSYTVYTSSAIGVSTMAALSDVITYDLATNNTSVAAIKATADGAQPAASDSADAVTAVMASLNAGTHTNITVDCNTIDQTISIAALGGIALAAISGARGTGNTLTATPADDWEVTYQWQSETAPGVWANVGSGGTSATHVELVADAARSIRCVVTPTGYHTNVLVPPGTPTTRTFGRNGGDVGDLLLGCIDGGGTIGSGDVTLATNLVLFSGSSTPGTGDALNALQVTGLNAQYAPGDTVTSVTITLFPWSTNPGANGSGGPDIELKVYHSLRDIIVNGYPDYTPNSTNAKTGLTWAANCASGSGDRSTELSRSAALTPGTTYVIPTSASLVALFQAAIDAETDKVDLLIQVEPGNPGSYRVFETAAVSDGARPYVSITTT